MTLAKRYRASKCRRHKHEWTSSWDWGRHKPKRRCVHCDFTQYEYAPSHWVEWTSLQYGKEVADIAGDGAQGFPDGK